jgi:hypothetical protein
VLEVRTPRVKLPDGSVHLIKPPFAGKLSGFTLLFEVDSRIRPRADVAAPCAKQTYQVWIPEGSRRRRSFGSPA